MIKKVKNKRTTKYTIITDIRDTLLAAVIIYIIGIALSWELNPMNWSGFGKAFSGIALLLVFWMWGSVIKIRYKTYKRKKEYEKKHKEYIIVSPEMDPAGAFNKVHKVEDIPHEEI